MENDVNKSIDVAIEKMADKTRAENDASKAMHYSQSALNLANAKAVLNEVKLSEALATSGKKTS